LFQAKGKQDTSRFHRFLSHWWIPLAMGVLLVPVVSFNMLLFHTLVELFAVSIAVVSFIVAWNTYPLAHNPYLLVLGCGYLSIGLLDLTHTLTFPGMPFFPVEDANLTIQYWVVARYYEAFLLLCAPLALRCQIKPSWALALNAILGLVAGLLVFTDLVPTMFVKGEGLTTAKIGSEFIICAMLIVAIWLLQRRKQDIDASIRYMVDVSIVLTILAELCFTLYADVHGVMFAAGHFFKLFSFWAIYVVLIESSLQQPFRTLARNANTYDAVPDETLVVDVDGIVRQVNDAVSRITGLDADACIGKSCHELQHEPSIPMEECEICRHIREHNRLDRAEFFDERKQRWYEISLTEISYGDQVAGMVHVRRDITAAKLAQQQFLGLNRLYTVLSQTNKVISHSDSRTDMFRDICQIAVQFGEFKMAWIGLINDDVVRPECSAGDESGYLDSIVIRVDQSDFGSGPAGVAVRSNKVTCVNDTETDPSFRPWRAAATKRGYRSMAAVPLARGEQAIGVCAFYSDVKGTFDEEMMTLMGTLGNDISSALVRLDEKIRQQLAEKKIRQLSLAVEQSANAIVITNTDFVIEYVNQTFINITGYSAHDCMGRTPLFFMEAGDRRTMMAEVHPALKQGSEWSGELQMSRKDGSYFCTSQSITPLLDDDGVPINYVATFEDITSLKDAQNTIEQLAFYDPLTELPNRRLLADRLGQAIERADRNPDTFVATLVFDLDNFKTINDSLGHNLGDELLKEVSKIFTSQVRSEDTVSRQGGDEFTIVLSGMRSVGKIADIADAIIQRLKQPIDLSGNQVIIGTSIGIAVYPLDAKNCDALLHCADMAMYYAKERGKNNFQFYTSEMNDKAHDRLIMENKLRKAIELGHFSLFYQPQIDLKNNELIGVEALIRWIDPDKGMISPLEFITLAEETGLIGPLGDWVIKTACNEMAAMQQQGLPEIKVAVNVSAYQFSHGDQLTACIEDSLAKSGLQPHNLSLELTESILIDDIEETISLLERLRSLDITLAVDDFGTGYSSLAYLKQFPIDVLKIDQAFIRDILDDDSDKAIVNAIIALARQLDLEVLAEGVETAEHHAYLQEQVCDYAQGYLYCKPIPATDLLTLWQQGKLIPQV